MASREDPFYFLDNVLNVVQENDALDAINFDWEICDIYSDECMSNGSSNFLQHPMSTFLNCTMEDGNNWEAVGTNSTQLLDKHDFNEDFDFSPSLGANDLPLIPDDISRNKRCFRSISLSLDDIEKTYSKSLVDASRDLGISITVLKKVCRRYGIHRWPHRKIASIDRMLDQIIASLSNLRQKSSVEDQDIMISKALQDRITILEEEKKDVYRTTSLGYISGRLDNKNKKVRLEKDIKLNLLQNTEDELDSNLIDFSILMAQKTNEELVSNMSYTVRSKQSKVISVDSFSSDTSSRKDHQRNQKYALQNQFDVTSLREQLIHLHQQALSMLNRPGK